MKTKKILSLVFCVVMMMGVVVSLSSCKVVNTVKGWFGKGECEHTFAEGWSTDATNHWHEATCEHTEEKGSLGAHADANKDGKCDTCAYTMSTDTGKPATPSAPTSAVYTVTVVNSKGEAVAGAKVKLIDKENSIYGDGVLAKITDEDGKVTFDTLTKAGWYAQVIEAPKGYAYVTELDEELGISFVKMYEFDDENNVTIILVDAPAV